MELKRLSRPRYWWYDYVRKSVIDSLKRIKVGKYPATLQETLAQTAVKRVLFELETENRGAERIAFIQLLYGKRTSTLPGIAMQMYISEGTARDWNRDFIYRVAMYMGFL